MIAGSRTTNLYLQCNVIPPPTNIFCKRPLVIVLNEVILERPVMKSRASIRKPSKGKRVLKSSPPPTWKVPLESALVSPKNRASPPPALRNGDTLEDGKNFTLADGVKKNVVKPGSRIPVFLDVANMTGNSRCSEATLKFASRFAYATS